MQHIRIHMPHDRLAHRGRQTTHALPRSSLEQFLEAKSLRGSIQQRIRRLFFLLGRHRPRDFVAILGYLALFGIFELSGVAYAQDQRWYVYRSHNAPENHGVWANLMPENGADMITFSTAAPLKDGPTASNTTAVRVAVRLKSPWWCGMVVSSNDQYWGEEKANAFDNQLTGAKKLVFWAKGAKGGENIQVKVAIAGGKPYGDSAPFPFVSDWIQLEPKWQKYELDVDGASLRRVVTPFVVVVDMSHNPSGEATFFLDEIYFQM